MNRIDRLTGILFRLQSQRYVKPKQLIEEYNISERTVFRDMNALLDAGVPLYSEPNRGYCLVEGYKLSPIMFSKDEVAALILSSKYAEQIADKSLLTDLSNALYKLRSVLPTETKEYIESIEKKTHVKPMQKNLINDNVIKKIQSAIASKHVLEISYYSNHSKKTSTRKIYPLSLVYYLFQWHLFAHCEMRDDIRDFRLDRIKEISSTGKEYYGFNEFDVNKYMKENEHRATSKIKIEIVNSLLAKFQQYFMDDRLTIFERGTTHTILEFESFHDNYAVSWLASFGKQCKVLGPENIRTLYIQNLKELLAQY